MSDLYIAYTPLHILFCLNHAKYTNQDSVICIANYFPHAPKIVNNIKAIYIPHIKFTLIAGRYNIITANRNRIIRKFQSNIISFTAYRQIEEMLRVHAIRNLYICNSSEPEVNHILQRSISENVKVIYLDDGLSTYLPSQNKNNATNRICMWNSKYANGTHPRIDEAIVLHPNWVDTRLREKHRTQMRPFVIEDMSLNLFEAFNVEELNYHEILERQNEFAIVCLPIISRSNINLCNRALEKIVASYKEVENVHLIVKHHPRSLVDMTTNLPENIIHVSKWLPAELLFALLKNKLHLLYSDLTTNLITAPWIVPTIECRFMNLGSRLSANEHIIDMFSALGIVIDS